ncbi:acetyltransferase family [Dissophora ornata]|nr:hypothetical protein BGZ58_000368 [Dissophora ornata]KAI8600930.1 acetyltransferase family [Dissophora ornata]
MNYSIRFVTTPEDMAKCHDVRYKVFSDEQGYDRDVEVDEIDSECLHWLAVDQDDQGVGTARLYKYKPTVGKVGRVAVLMTTRGSGLGRLLMEAIEKYANENMKLETLALSSQCPRSGFYEKLGYVAQGEIYLDEGQPHIYMVKALSQKSS